MESSRIWTRFASILAAGLLVAPACSSSGSGGAGSGGANGSGGQGTGGVPATGGHSATGGASASGGASATGGNSPGTGGVTSSGGAGGSVHTGGTSGSGGRGTGGNPPGTGGMTGTGGAGGAAATGGGGGGAGGSEAQQWVGTWTASPYLDTGNPPPASLSNSALRQVTHVSLGGSQLRVQISNLDGTNGSLSVKSAHIALCKATPSVDSTIDTATDKALTFSGAEAVTIGAGKEIWSDPVDFALPPKGNLTITMALGGVPGSITQHSGSRTTSYEQTNSSTVTGASMTSAMTTDHWFFISGIDVMADASARGVVAVGDSITDGRGTDTNQNDRWTDLLEARLLANPSTANVSMMNQGIGATTLIGNSGTAAQARFNRDVLGQSGVRYVIIFDGVNDILADASFSSMKSAYQDLISRAHAKGLLIYGATITPFGAYSSYSSSRESVRQQVNTFIKSGAFDGVIDFDAAVTDGGSPPKLQSQYATWSQQDGLHPGPAGYQKMASVVDLTLFTK
jgi:lysophospholipase L1-like esterase